ncbi:MAG TPA: beta-ketoacyl synthase N-terminal-like domain-containing protein, partial [Kofleriaceae bacterium]|nr:beta-ketoacyl synthase N-terminal-like domain-containing protein [Kofleriaceae bacterium]
MTEPIAIVGMACRFPGATSLDAYWQLLVSGTDAVREPPRGRRELRPPRWLVEQAPAASRGGFLERLDQFEPSFFRISPREAARMDPQQRLLLEVTWEALENAGQPVAALSGTQTGVFVGIMNADFARRHAQNLTQIDAQLGPGSSLGIASNRVSFLLDLRGPSMSVDTLCSSSLVAIHLACQSLHADESAPIALAGGVNVILDRTMDVFYGRAGLLSADGHCRAFDANARGIVRGEGCGILVLKRLSRAQADGDRIHALVLGSAVNQDGRSNGLTSPSRWSQEEVLRSAYRRAGVAPGSVAYIEAHGTGTLIGDPIEAAALGAVVGEGRTSPCLLGSVKSNLGHLESAAGVASVIKSVLALTHGTIPPSLHYTVPNPYARLAERALEVATEPRPLPRKTEPTITGVSSFGMGGTNAHIVLASAEARPRAATDGEGPILVPLSAASAPALDALQARYADLLESGACSLTDLAYSASLCRDHYDLRCAVVATSATDAVAQLRQRPAYSGKVMPGQTHRVVFVHAPDARGADEQIAFWRACGIEASGEDVDADHTVEITIGASGDREAMLHALAGLYCVGIDIEWRRVQAGQFVELGTYPWQRELSWLEPPPSPASERLSRSSIIASLPEGVLVPTWERAGLPGEALPAERQWVVVGEGPTATTVAAALGTYAISDDAAPPAASDVIVMCAGD